MDGVIIDLAAYRVAQAPSEPEPEQLGQEPAIFSIVVDGAPVLAGADVGARFEIYGIEPDDPGARDVIHRLVLRLSAWLRETRP